MGSSSKEELGNCGILLEAPLGTMSRRRFLELGGIWGAGAAIAAVLPSVLIPKDAAARGRTRRAKRRRTRRASRAQPGSAAIALGGFAAGTPWGFENVDEFSRLAGQGPAIIHWFEHWLMDFNPRYMDAAVARGGMPMVSWEPWNWEMSLEQPEYALKKINQGVHDAYIRGWARAAAAWEKPFFLRFAAEMNGDWRPWSPGVNGNSAAEFVSCWRRIHSIFRQEGAVNAKWVWSPIVNYEGATPFKDVYPGDAYTDWVGIDGYNWGTTRSWSRWQSFTEIFGASYGELTATKRKPLMIAEVASAEQGGDKAAWIEKTFLDEIPNRFPLVKGVVWFHANKETDWRIDSSDGALEAYRKVAASSRYQGSFL